MEIRQYLIFVPMLLVWAIIGFLIIASPVDDFLFKQFFSRIPKWFLFTEISDNLSNYRSSVLIITALAGLLFNGLVGPVVEELYFRGYLLPRISRYGGFAPVINMALFSLYHFFTPWQFFSRFIGFAPTIFMVWKKRNLYLGIWVHCLMNTIATLSMIMVVTNQI
jgi:membrane protease YdiL (CAAX protease family)